MLVIRGGGLILEGGWAGGGGAGPLGVRDYLRRALGPAGCALSAHGRPLPSIGPCLAQLLQNKNDVVNTTCQPSQHMPTYTVLLSLLLVVSVSSIYSIPIQYFSVELSYLYSLLYE